MTVPVRERLLHAAHTLFSGRSVHQVSIDDIVREARSTKATLYRHYRSKDDLLLAVMRWESRAWLHGFQDNVARLEPHPARQLLVVVDALAGGWARPGFRGRVLTRLVLEQGDPDHPAGQVLEDHQRRVREYLAVLARRAGRPEPDRLAAELHLVLEGAALLAGVGRDSEAFSRARAIAEQLLGDPVHGQKADGA